MPGPLPVASGKRRRRNAPTIPTTRLPAGGFAGEVPDAPYELRAAGTCWWEWAWATPQAAAWSDGDLFALGRRAGLEDDLVALGEVSGGLDLDYVMAEEDVSKAVRDVIGALQGLAAAKTTLISKMLDLDDRFGLTAKGLAALRWEIVADDVSEGANPAPIPPPDGVSSLEERRNRLTGS